MAKFEDIKDKFLAEVGTTEYPPNSNNVKYNTDYYGKVVSGSSFPWCMVFIWWVLRLYKTASCTSFVNWAKQRGKFKTSNPQVGDCVLFNFDKNPTPNTYKHIGWILEVNNGSITTIEGNTSTGTSGSQDNGGCVAKRTRKLDKHIMGYIVVDYESDIKGVTPKPKVPVLRQGMRCDAVKLLHSLLKPLGYGVNPEDNYFSSTTRLCVINYQATNYLEPDGIVGEKTWNSLLKNK